MVVVAMLMEMVQKDGNCQRLPRAMSTAGCSCFCGGGAYGEVSGSLVFFGTVCREPIQIDAYEVTQFSSSTVNNVAP